MTFKKHINILHYEIHAWIPARYAASRFQVKLYAKEPPRGKTVIPKEHMKQAKITGLCLTIQRCIVSYGIVPHYIWDTIKDWVAKAIMSVKAT